MSFLLEDIDITINLKLGFYVQRSRFLRGFTTDINLALFYMVYHAEKVSEMSL